jgi:hypothetical protein
MTEPSSPGSEPSSPARGIVGLVVANTSLIAGILIYMGWSYDNALYERFHLNPIDLGFGPQEYALRSLSLFSSAIVIIAVLFIVVLSVRAWWEPQGALAVLAAARRAPRPVVTATATGDGPAADAARPLPEEAGRSPTGNQSAEGTAAHSVSARTLAITGGVAVTAVGLALSWIATQVNVSTFLVLALLGGGPLLLTWPGRGGHLGRVPYALALVIAAICALWAGSVYAQQKGAEAAQNVIRGLPTGDDVVILSTQLLALSGDGVTVTPLTTSEPYRYEYQGLHLLLVQSGTYYLLGVRWTPLRDYTYIVDASDATRIVLY